MNVFRESSFNLDEIFKVESQIYPHSYDIEDGDTIEMSKVFARNLLFNKQVMGTMLC